MELRLLLCFLITLCIKPASSQTADFSADATTGCEYLTVKFPDLSTGSIKAWKWNFGNGAFSSQQNPLHTYATVAGSYQVSLEVTDNSMVTQAVIRFS
jgi:PKD repeat protein